MRIRNKELRNKWRRKEKRVKTLIQEAIAASKGGKKAEPAKPKPAPVAKENPAAKPATAAAKPKKAPAKKKEAPAE